MAEIDETTGLPEAPEGMFWRVKANWFWNSPKVQLRKKMWIGSYVVDDAFTLDDFRRIEDEILWLAEIILDRVESRSKREVDLGRVMGDYPPKRLA